MPGWVTELAPVAPWLVAIIIVIGALTWLGQKAVPVLRKAVHFIDDVVGEPERPGQPARPGLMERMKSIEDLQRAQAAVQVQQGETLGVVRHELFSNSGKSLRDRVDHIAVAVGLEQTERKDDA